jgi:chaperonin GroES
MAYSQAASSDKPKAPKLQATLAKLLTYESAPNIAELLDQVQLDKIGYDVERNYKIDETSRDEWKTAADKAMKVALQVRQPKNYPFQGASNVKYPLVTVAALQFGARAYPAIVDGNRIVKGQVVGDDEGIPDKDENDQPRIDPANGEPIWLTKPGFKRDKAERVSRHMSYQLLNEMPEWEEDTDILLHHLPIVGCAFRKVWRSEELGRNKAEMVAAVDLVVNQKARSLDEAPRVTHILPIYPQAIEHKKRVGTYLDIELPAPISTDGVDGSDEDAPHTFLEQHCYLDLDEDGYREPYIVTVHKDSCKVVRIVANFDITEVKDDGKRIVMIPKEQYFVKYSFLPDPKGGFYSIGFGALLESLSETIDTTINQLLDAGHLQNAGGGFISSGVRLKKNTVQVSPGKYEVVQASGDIRGQIYSHQFPGPSPVLFQLLGMMVEAARDITATKDILTGDTGGKVQTATTTLAMIEQGLKVFTAIYKRVYRALKDEFKLLFILNAKYTDEKAYYTFNDKQEVVQKQDYDIASMDVCPVADPSMVTDMQRQAKTQVLLQITENPVLGPLQNGREVLSRVYDTARIEDSDKLLVPEQKGPSPAEQLQVAAATSEIENTAADTAKKTAETEKTQLETLLLPAEKMAEAHQQDMDEANRQKDREHAAVVEAEKSSLSREQMTAKQAEPA